MTYDDSDPAWANWPKAGDSDTRDELAAAQVAERLAALKAIFDADPDLELPENRNLDPVWFADLAETMGW